jgi:hypothetical protein
MLLLINMPSNHPAINISPDEYDSAVKYHGKPAILDTI